MIDLVRHLSLGQYYLIGAILFGIHGFGRVLIHKSSLRIGTREFIWHYTAVTVVLWPGYLAIMGLIRTWIVVFGMERTRRGIEAKMREFEPNARLDIGEDDQEKKEDT